MNPWISIALEIVSAPAKSQPLYLDPGSGSFLIQLIIASALGAALVIKTSWSRIKKFFNRNASEVEEIEDELEDE
ncbi:MAG: hypothetical protein ACK2T5_01580 [Anaerolineales bacterium]|jgi:hypothetical protein